MFNLPYAMKRKNIGKPIVEVIDQPVNLDLV